MSRPDDHELELVRRWAEGQTVPLDRVQDVLQKWADYWRTHESQTDRCGIGDVSETYVSDT